MYLQHDQLDGVRDRVAVVLAQEDDGGAALGAALGGEGVEEGGLGERLARGAAVEVEDGGAGGGAHFHAGAEEGGERPEKRWDSIEFSPHSQYEIARHKNFAMEFCL